MEKEGQRRSKRYYWNDARDNKKIPKTWRLAQEKNPKPGQLMALMRRSSLEPDPLFAQLTETKNHQEAHARLHAPGRPHSWQVWLQFGPDPKLNPTKVPEDCVA